MKLYKLTDQDGFTRRGHTNETHWTAGVEHTATGNGGLCTDGVIHAYRHPLLAVFLNPVHANINNPILWECSAEEIKEEKADKCGVKALKTLKKIALPVLTTEQRIRFAIRVVLSVYNDKKQFRVWAINWLNGADRSTAATYAAAAATSYATNAANAAAYAAAAATYAYATAANYTYAINAATYAIETAIDAATDITWQKLLEFAQWAVTKDLLPNSGVEEDAATDITWQKLLEFAQWAVTKDLLPNSGVEEDVPA